jgi:hypothetical protein
VKATVASMQDNADTFQLSIGQARSGSFCLSRVTAPQRCCQQ